jgi:hypothetical protein
MRGSANRLEGLGCTCRRAIAKDSFAQTSGKGEALRRARVLN